MNNAMNKPIMHAACALIFVLSLVLGIGLINQQPVQAAALAQPATNCYKLTVNSSFAGSISTFLRATCTLPDHTQGVVAGSRVTLTATPISHGCLISTFDHWLINVKLPNPQVNPVTFRMPAHPVTAAAAFSVSLAACPPPPP